MSLSKLVWFVVLLVALTALAVACGGGDNGDGAEEGGDDASAIRSTLERLFEAAADGDWQKMYDLTSASYQARCSFDEFTQLAELAEEAIAERTLHDVQDISISGDQALATVTVEISGSRIGGTFAFVREDGAWLHVPSGGPSEGCAGLF
jgi:hypothetical protein